MTSRCTTAALICAALALMVGCDGDGSITPDSAVDAAADAAADATPDAADAMPSDARPPDMADAIAPDAGCTPGAAGCVCAAGDGCDPGAECTDGTCQSCLDRVGCTCADVCAGALACDADTATCRPAVTCAELVCGRGRLCLDEEGRDGACQDACEDGYVWDPVQRRCDEVATCESLDCAAEGRVCDDSGDAAACGACLDGFDEVDGACVRVGGCAGPGGIEAMCAGLNRSCEEDGDGLGSCGPCDEGFFPDAADPDGACVAVGEACAQEADCAEGLFCVQLRAPEGQVAPAGVCIPPPCPDGQVYDSTTGACAAASADILARCAEQGALGPWPVTDFDGNPVCRTAPGYFFDTTPAVRAAVPCDADGDGWVRRSASAEIESDDLARSQNARCDLRTVYAVALVNEWGQRLEADLPDGLDSTALYEPDSIDVDGDPGGLQERAYGDRRFAAAELNPLTKGCVSRRSDLNANGLDDIVEHQGALPPDDRLWMAPLTAFGFFTELYSATYEPPAGGRVHGLLVVSARNRCGDFPLGYQGDDADWWRSCTRRRDAGYGANGAGAGYDFARYACAAERGDCAPEPPRTGPAGPDGALLHGLCAADQLDPDPIAWRPLGHFSQFRCVEVVADAAEPEAHQLRHTALYTGERGAWQLNRCGLGAEGGPLTCASDIAQTLDAEQRGGVTGTLVDEVAWVARRFVPYPTVDDYPGGCVSEWVESPALCGGGDDIAGASGAFGQVLCGCDGEDFELPLADNQVGACAGSTKQCVDGRLVEPVPPAEVCDLSDTDCDGRIDENLTNRCGGCGPVPAETCNGLDDDCDGSTDEDFLINQRCADGVGECRRSGFTICGENGDVVCEAIAANPQREGCDRGADFDCDGRTGEGTSEVCDGTDNDCDGFTDEEMVTDWSCAPSVRAVFVGQPIDGIFEPSDPRLMVAERSVRFDRDVLVSQVEETVANYREVASTYRWALIGENGACQNRNAGNTCPALMNWYTAVAYANGRSIAEGYDPCYRMVGCQGRPGDAGFACDYVAWDETQDCSGYRLPTASEWEYAARAGGNYDVPTGEAALLDVAWCDDRGLHYSACALGVDHTWELCDVYGNLAEWVWDAYGPPPIDRIVCDGGGCRVTSEQDYLGPGGDSAAGADRVLAGGHAATDDLACGPVARDRAAPTAVTNIQGLRLMRTANAENRNPEHLVDADGASYDLDPLFDARGRAEAIFDIEAVGDVDYFRFSLAEEAYVSIETIGLASAWTRRNGEAIDGLVNPSATGGAVQCDMNVALSLYRSGNAVRVEPAIASDQINQGAGLCALIDDFDPRGDPGRSRLPAGEYQVKVEGLNRAVGTARLVVRKLQVAREGETCSAAAVYPTYTGLAYPPCLDGLTCFEGSVIGPDQAPGSLTDDKGVCVSIEDLADGITESRIVAGQLDVKRVVMVDAGRIGVETLPPEGVNCTVQRDTELRIYRESDGRLVEIAYDDNGGLGFCSRIDVPVQAGTYYVAVNAFDHQFDIDAYRLRLGGAVCGAGDMSPPCNGCPEGTAVPLGWVCAPAGDYVRGEPGNDGRPEQPAHQVTLTRPFLMQSTEVTRAAWQGLMGTTPWSRPDGDPDNLFCDSGCPVYRVSWWEAAAYANALSRAEGLQECYDLSRDMLRWSHDSDSFQRVGTCADLHTGDVPIWQYVLEGQDYAVPMWWDLRCADEAPFAGLDCNGYRLPTEAEWEYAARAGTDSGWFFGDDPATLAQYAWYRESSGQRAHVVGELLPNPWGLYDIYGNVSEWVHGWHHGDDFFIGGYAGVAQIDPLGPAFPDVLRRIFVRGPDRWYDVARNDTDYFRVHRGGAFDYEVDPGPGAWLSLAADADDTRSSTRHRLESHYRMRTVGFRLVRTAP